jgi:uncharacterized membrane protein
MRTAVILAVVLSTSAQTQTQTQTQGGTSSSHSGWSFTDTLQTATDILVADITAASAVDTGSQVNVKATLHAIRVLSGGIAPGADLTLQWRYRPGPTEGPSFTTKVAPARGLWFLHKNPEGALEPLQAGVMAAMGGSFLPLPSGAPSPLSSYSYDQPLQTKIAREIGAAIEDLATQHAADFAPHSPEAPVGGVLRPWVQTRAAYQSLTTALQSLEHSAANGVYQYFSTFPDPNLKTLGIFGRLFTGDTSAVFDLEKNLASVVSTSDTSHFAPSIMGLDLRQNLPAAHTLARIALSDTTIPGLEGALAFTLARTRSPEMLPYLIVMLGSPEPGIRDSAILGFCQLLGPMPSPAALWSPEMAGYCPNHSPLNDPALEQKDTEFWRQWWESRRDEISKTVALPTVTAPARYSRPPDTGWQEVTEVPMEIRFESLLHMSEAMQPEHYHTADGTLVEGPPPAGHDPVGGQLQPADREIYRQVLESVNAKLAALETRSQQMLNAARIAGTQPDLERSKVLWADHESALKTGLAGLQSKLSPEGWQSVERFLKNTGAGMMMRAAPVK